MKQYLLSVYQPDGDPPPPEVLAPIVRRLEEMKTRMVQAGAWVFTVGLHPASSATVVRAQDSDVLITDGPFTEGKEHLGGFNIVNAPDLDAALRWGRELAEATTLPVEVRPILYGPE
jgi:hypothetical protein